MLAGGLTLLTASVSVWGLMERWQPAGTEILANPRFLPGVDGKPLGWSVRPGLGEIAVSDGSVSLRSPSPARTVAITQPIVLAGPRAFRFRADVGYADVTTGERSEPWHAARVVLTGRRPDGSLDTDTTGDLLRRTGSRDLRPYQATVVLDADLVEAVFMVRLDRVSGALTVENPTVVPVSPRPAYQVASTITACLWAVVLPFVVVLFMAGSTSRTAASVVVVVIALGGLLNLLQSDLTMPLFRVVQAVGGNMLTLTGVDRLAHFSGFVLLTMAWRRARSADGWLSTGAILAALAIGSETMQGITGGLGLDDVIDVGINLLGVAVGGLLVLGAGRFSKRNEGA